LAQGQPTAQLVVQRSGEVQAVMVELVWAWAWALLRLLMLMLMLALALKLVMAMAMAPEPADIVRSEPMCGVKVAGERTLGPPFAAAAAILASSETRRCTSCALRPDRGRLRCRRTIFRSATLMLR
jgi:hypothetical protein